MSKKKIIIIGIIILLSIALLWNYISYSHVEFKLVGSSEINMEIGDTWTDPGYILKKDNNDFDNKVEIDGQVANEVGSYNIVYKTRIGLFTKKIVRKINVIENNMDFILELNGDNTYYLMQGKEYIDPGVIAYDVIDGDITKNVISNNNINNSTDGTYEVSYMVTNSSFVNKKVTRKVVVYSFAFESKLKNTENAQENEVIINITDDTYEYTVLPDGKVSGARNIAYPVEENGVYDFKFYDVNNGVFEYEVEIKNVDSEKPTGTCILNLYDTGAKIEVSAKDNDAIKGYIYHYGNKSTSLLNDTSYSISTMDEKASVTVYDTSNNSVDISCNTIDKATVIPKSYTSESFSLSNGRKYEYWFYKPKNSVRQKLPLLLYLHGDGGKKGMANVNLYAYPSFIYNGADFPFYMLAPHVDLTDDFASDNRMPKTYELINYIVSNYNIDRDRIIIVGGSSGARGAYRMASTYKNLFSCLVIGSGSTTYQLYDDQLTYLPIWFFQGEKDPTIDYKYIESHVNNINKLGGNAKLTVIKDGNHEITETVFKYPELIEWMISQKRK